MHGGRAAAAGARAGAPRRGRGGALDRAAAAGVSGDGARAHRGRLDPGAARAAPRPGRGRVRAEARRRRRRADRPGRLPRRRGAGRRDRGGAARTPGRDRHRPPVREVDDLGSHVPVRAAGALDLRQAGRPDDRRRARRGRDRRLLVRAPPDPSRAASRFRVLRTTCRRCGRPASSRTAPFGTSGS